jgi:hypothetical protein
MPFAEGIADARRRGEGLIAKDSVGPFLFCSLFFCWVYGFSYVIAQRCVLSPPFTVQLVMLFPGLVTCVDAERLRSIIDGVG